MYWNLIRSFPRFFYSLHWKLMHATTALFKSHNTLLYYSFLFNWGINGGWNSGEITICIMITHNRYFQFVLFYFIFLILVAFFAVTKVYGFVLFPGNIFYLVQYNFKRYLKLILRFNECFFPRCKITILKVIWTESMLSKNIDRYSDSGKNLKNHFCDTFKREV